jgi:alkylation response protein AidB-like acyl-CoA dehydrogenase
MSYELSREHEEFRLSVREFAEAEIGPYAAQWDRDHHFPVDVVQKMGKLGLPSGSGSTRSSPTGATPRSRRGCPISWRGRPLRASV